MANDTIAAKQRALWTISLGGFLPSLRADPNTPAAAKPLTAKGGRKVVIRTGDEVIEYSGGETFVRGRISPTSQDALEPRLEALAKERDDMAARVNGAHDTALEAAKAIYQAAVKDADDAQAHGINLAISTYEQSAREAILAASAGGKP